jgi:HEAT repeat protein
MLLTPLAAQSPAVNDLALRRVDALIKQWREDPSCEPLRLAMEFVALGKVVTPRLCNLLDSSEEQLPRVEMTMALGRLGDDRAVGSLAKLFARTDVDVRLAAVEALDRLDFRECLPVLVAALDDEDGRVAKRAESALQIWPDKPGVLDAVKQRLPAAAEKSRLAQVLATTGTDECHALLLDMLASDDGFCVVAALQGLQSAPKEGDAKRVVELLSSTRTSAVKREACSLLGKLRYRPAAADLIELLTQEDPGLVASAHWALKQITGQQLKPDVALWREWWNRSRQR